VGDPWLPDDELTRVLSGKALRANVLDADDFGVWVSGTAPLRDAQGAIVAAVTVDAPVLESLDRSAQTDRSLALAATLQSAAIRFSRAEVEAITDGLTGLYNHRYCTSAWKRSSNAPGATAARFRCFSATATTSRSTTTTTATSRATPRWSASRGSSRPAAGASIWPPATAARSSCSRW